MAKKNELGRAYNRDREVAAAKKQMKNRGLEGNNLGSFMQSQRTTAFSNMQKAQNNKFVNNKDFGVIGKSGK